MIELRWVVPSNTFVPGNDWPKLQYRTPKLRDDGHGHVDEMWTEWTDVPLVVLPSNGGVKADAEGSVPSTIC